MNLPLPPQARVVVKAMEVVGGLVAHNDPENINQADQQCQLPADEREISRGKTRRVAIIAGGLAVATSIAAGTFLHVFDRTAGDTETLARGLGNFLSQAKPHKSIETQVQSAFESVTLGGPAPLGSGVVKSSVKRDVSEISCTLTCVTLTALHGSVVIFNTANEVIPESGIDLSVGHKGNGTEKADYFPIAFVDPTTLEINTGYPNKADLKKAHLPIDTPLITYGGKDGTIASISGAFTDQNPDADNYAVITKTAIDAVKSNCGPVLDTLIPAGIAQKVTQRIKSAIDLLATLPAIVKQSQSVDYLKQLLKNPVHIRFVRNLNQDTGRAQYTYYNAQDVHGYTGAPVVSSSISTPEDVGYVKKTDLRVDPNSCVVTGNALRDVSDITTENNNYVLDPLPGQLLDSSVKVQS